MWMKSLSVTIQMKVLEQYFPLVPFIMLLYKVVIIFESVAEILKSVIIQIKGGSNVYVCR